MSATPATTPLDVEVFRPRTWLWLLLIGMLLALLALDARVLAEDGWPSFSFERPRASGMYAAAMLRIWVLMRCVSSLVLAPSFALDREGLSVRGLVATRRVLWRDIRAWSLSNGSQASLFVGVERVRIMGSMLGDPAAWVAALTRRIGHRPTLEVGITSELARRFDAAVIVSALVLYALSMRESLGAFGATFGGSAACLAIGASLYRAKPSAPWKPTWMLAMMVAVALGSVFGFRGERGSAGVALATGGFAGLLLTIAVFALGIVPRAPRATQPHA